VITHAVVAWTYTTSGDVTTARGCRCRCCPHCFRSGTDVPPSRLDFSDPQGTSCGSRLIGLAMRCASRRSIVMGVDPCGGLKRPDERGSAGALDAACRPCSQEAAYRLDGPHSPCSATRTWLMAVKRSCQTPKSCLGRIRTSKLANYAVDTAPMRSVERRVSEPLRRMNAGSN
jgi:hypothetical protein